MGKSKSSFNYKSTERWLNNIKEKGKNLDNFFRKTLYQVAIEALAAIQENTPVDTGTLKEAWKMTSIERIGNTYVVLLYNNQDYASYVEEGHQQKARWLPGVWSGGKFRYVPNAKTGIMLTTRKIPGVFMAKFGIEETLKKFPEFIQNEITVYLNTF